MSNSESSHTYPLSFTWPPEELETVSYCPVCMSSESYSFYDELVDDVFFVAPGRWTLKKCNSCASAYISPRPKVENMSRAYGNYYTHKTGAVQEKIAEIGFLRSIRRIFANGYLNSKYGSKRKPSIQIGAWILQFFPRLTSVLDAQYRFLPNPLCGQSLLDIGCGNGDFLLKANEVGWHAIGLEPDLKAAQTAQKKGLEVIVGDIDAIKNNSNMYDVITLSHVIEHVHEPRMLLNAAYRLLKDGGLLYIDTPNINSYGASYFQKKWRGIEAPRHLVLFNHKSLIQLLRECGFENIQLKRRVDVQKGMYLISKQLADKCNYFENDRGWLAKFMMLMPFVKTNKLEYITLIAKKN
jgi:2-polyprenyl-3-methyl-5-hydroxy-6-metoxy-1,4-benzoquinol methylase